MMIDLQRGGVNRTDSHDNDDVTMFPLCLASFGCYITLLLCGFRSAAINLPALRQKHITRYSFSLKIILGLIDDG